MEALAKFQNLLRDLFQLDTADLDFGLYRLLHLKRDEIEAFITEQLPRRVEEAFQQVGEGERREVEARLQRLQGEIRREFGDEAILPDGSLAERYRRPNGKTLRELVGTYETERQKLAQAQATEAQAAEVFNHLYAFFSRYYEDGDFIPKRRYGASETYAVPYNGEEVLLHWANKGQHYVKTGERLRDYAFTVDALGGPYRVRFVLTEATVPRENTKGDTRYFFPRPDAARYEDKTFTLPFEYRLPTQEEMEHYGRNAKAQEAILQEALEPILAAVPGDALAVALKQVVQEKETEQVTLLLRHLRHFTRRQTSDYFIHPRLKEFLTRELEFYLKDQALHLEDLDPDLFPARLRTLRVIRQLGEEIIAFLDQLEQVQCRLFEKRKFVLRTDYLCTLQHVPRDLWPEILANEAQRAEWQRLFAVDGPVDEAFLQTHPTLVVNTAHFDGDFTERLLAAFPDLDEATDGLLVHGENYQALNLLLPRYRGQVKCIYIDPPFDSERGDLPYKDRYPNSTWLTLVMSRARLAYNLLRQDGVLFLHLDDKQSHLAKKAHDFEFSGERFQNEIVWAYGSSARGAKAISGKLPRNHDVLLTFAKDPFKVELRKVRVPFRVHKSKARKYGYRQDENGLWFKTSPRGDYTDESIAQLESEGRIHVTASGNIRIKYFLRTEGDYVIDDRLVGDVWDDIPDMMHAPKEERTGFDTQKPVRLIERVVQMAASNRDVVLDYFAGSGTTGHAVINLNREDGGRRKFLLVEMADYFDTVLLPRIQKVMYCPNWKDGKPVDYPQPSLAGMWPEWVARTPRLVKVIRLEGYEDALHNLVTEETLARERERAAATKEAVGADAYRLRYLARLPLEASATMLATENLAHPFRYTLEVLTDEGPATRVVDLVETFNYLVGLRVRRVETWRSDDGRAYRAISGEKADGKRVLVLWRDMEGLDPEAERAFLEAKLTSVGANGGSPLWDEILINGDCAVEGVASLDPLFKRLMMAGEGE